MKFLYTAISIGMLCTLTTNATRTVYLPMDISSDGTLVENTSNLPLSIIGMHAPENVAGAKGNALRLDGYSTYAYGKIGTQQKSTTAITFAVWVAPETYPIMKIDQATDEKALMAGTIDHTQKKGWSFNLGYTGKYNFECYSGGWKVTVEASDLLPTYEWSRLVAVADCTAKKVTLYRNGIKVGEGKCMNSVDNDSDLLRIGKDDKLEMTGPFLINTFNGLIDDVEVFDTALSEDEIKGTPDNKADLSIPESRFANDHLRPHFHGMPAAGWTNECHGMTYSNGKFHVFFQKNANGPYMTRLHWGHISSSNLFDWKEEKIAIMPGDYYDIKGCWSGCVFTDPTISGGKPAAIYTAVDYIKAIIALAEPQDDNLIDWKKSIKNPIINGRPSGLSDDFRDPYFFRNGDNAYIIVGTSKNGIGATTLHRYNSNSGSWSNDGSIFFAGTSAAQDGTFWEMPNITKMANGKWLFTATPLNTSNGVKTLYWVGDINADGTFKPTSSTPRQIELISRNGYGLLSPTIYNHEGKTLMLGIVPDKLPAEENARLGWAHLYSLPREIWLDDSGELRQKPYDGLKNMRGNVKFNTADKDLNGTMAIANVTGNRVELLGRFVAGNSPFGFNILKSGSGQGVITINPSTGILTVDLTGLQRISNDSRSFDGKYTCSLPEKPAAGQEVTLNVFIDGSIMDIFINNRWATSIRVFPKAADSYGYEAFSNGETKTNEISAWTLSSQSGIDGILDEMETESDLVDVINPSGMVIRRSVPVSESHDGLDPGIYIIGNKTVCIR